MPPLVKEELANRCVRRYHIPVSVKDLALISKLHSGIVMSGMSIGVPVPAPIDGLSDHSRYGTYIPFFANPPGCRPKCKTPPQLNLSQVTETK